MADLGRHVVRHDAMGAAQTFKDARDVMRNVHLSCSTWGSSLIEGLGEVTFLRVF